MAKGHSATVVLGVICGAVLTPVDVYAERTVVATVVVHVTDYQHVPPARLAEGQTLAATIYDRIGVKLVWDGGARAQAAEDGFTHVDLVIFDAAMSDRLNRQPTAVGQASHATKRAIVFYPRVERLAEATLSDPSRMFAVIIAHELGHVLLPEYSHTTHGLMRATSHGRVVEMPDFAANQAKTIRATLAAEQ